MKDWKYFNGIRTHKQME